MIYKKPRFWDFPNPNLFTYLLFPLTIPIRMNNFLLNNKSKIKSKDIFTICVGNIYLGGTGKTPTAIKLNKILTKYNLNVAIGRKFYPSHKDEIKILNEESNLLISSSRDKILSLKNLNVEVIIFDDGLQDKKIDYDLKFVCFDCLNWIGNGLLIPAGPLRENLKSLKKYDAVFLKNFTNSKKNIIKIIKKINHKIKIFFTNYKITNLNKFNFANKYLIFSGIGNPEDFKNILIKNNIKIIHEMIFPDHFDYKVDDLRKVKKIAKKYNAKIITTEKDYVKLPKKERRGIDYIKIELIFKNQKSLIHFIKKKINEKI